MKHENPLEEVWRVRAQISAESGYDVGRLFKRLRALERQHADRLVQPPPSRPAKPETAAILREEPPPYGRKPRGTHSSA